MPLIWNDAIIDRTEQDVERVKELNYKWLMGTISDDEKDEWENDLKGALNTSDLVRIENNIQLLSDVLELDLHTHVGDIPVLPREAYFNDLVQNITAIRNTIYVHSYTPQPPSQPLNLYTKWNDIEKILDDVYTILNNNFYYFCNEGYYCGDQFGLLL